MTTYTIISESKIRLDELLRQKLPELTGLELSNSKIRRLIMAGCIRVNGREVRIPSYTVFVKSNVEAFVDKEKILYEKQADDISFEVTEESVLYEDEYLIFINKPAKFPTEKTIVTDRDNLHDAVVRYLWKKNPSLRNPPYVGIMHRLDKDTSGVILFTKKREVNKAIFDMFDSSKLDLNETSEMKYRPVQKTYVAVVKDSVKIKESFTVKNFLGRITSKSAGCKWGEVPESRGGLIAVTEFKVIKRDAGRCYLECHPVTGRTHQIRIHLAGRGTPISGDTLYNGDKAERLFLHAKSLELTHPVTGEKISVSAPCNFS
ncbi:MAG: RluA family pseudouridine synthase [Treponema sp.]|uniref:RluA family pseudouridine synthase n=1 Tax=Treponema sp. TaxID=166 RepID=UPI00298D7E5E|nr:RluA family pseudouridine synthase [Treponema sp.]MCQ2599750.1 RluA family pseudouridine synthase [Treponema sp.]